jgi:hypothetical protein
MASDRKYEGVSSTGNLQQAIEAATKQIQPDFPDAIATWTLEEVRGQRGGIAGLHTVSVVITATQGKK